MKKLVVALIAMVVIGAGFFVFKQSDKPKEKTNSTSNKSSVSNTKQAVNTKAACDLLNLADAKSLIGEGAYKIEQTGNDNASTGDFKVDNCSYSVDGATLGDTKQITLQVRTGSKEQAKASYDNYNKEFPGDPVTGLGDDAIVTKEGSNISVLKNNSALLVFGGSVRDGADKEMCIKAAKIVLAKL